MSKKVQPTARSGSSTAESISDRSVPSKASGQGFSMGVHVVVLDSLQDAFTSGVESPIDQTSSARRDAPDRPVEQLDRLSCRHRQRHERREPAGMGKVSKAKRRKARSWRDGS